MEKSTQLKHWDECEALKIGKYDGIKNPFYGLKHSAETIAKIIEKNQMRPEEISICMTLGMLFLSTNSDPSGKQLTFQLQVL
jgi:hypothetical protein